MELTVEMQHLPTSNKIGETDSQRVRSQRLLLVQEMEYSQLSKQLWIWSKWPRELSSSMWSIRWSMELLVPLTSSSREEERPRMRIGNQIKMEKESLTLKLLKRIKNSNNTSNSNSISIIISSQYRWVDNLNSRFNNSTIAISSLTHKR